MAYALIKTRVKNYTPAAVGSGETTTIFPLKKGTRVLSIAIKKLVLNDGTTPTVQLQMSGGNAAGLLAATNTFGGAVGDVIDGNAADFNRTGYLCTSDQNLQAQYVVGGGAGTIAPTVRVAMRYTDDPVHPTGT